VDKIFTRVGASDNLSTGESTFMVEMTETASILNNISDRSLLLLDEIGRGTATYDGVSLAWAISEYLHEHPAMPKTLFATHYHELNDMAGQLSRVQNFHVSVKEHQGKMVFLRTMKRGSSEHSFGIHVARMAGIPGNVVKRSEQILKSLEDQRASVQQKGRKKQSQPDPNMQLQLFQMDDPQSQQLKEALEKVDVNTLTPVEALMKLNELKNLIDKPDENPQRSSANS
jgi:DNA mismatch repair protein MutS